MFNQRTIEIYRGLGLEAEIVEAANLEFEQDGAIVSVESLTGKELEYYFRNVNEGYEPLSRRPGCSSRRSGSSRSFADTRTTWARGSSTRRSSPRSSRTRTA